MSESVHRVRDLKKSTRSSNSHRNPARESQFHCDLYSILIQKFQYLEHGQHLDDDQPHRHVCKMSPDTDLSAESERNVCELVGFRRAIVVEEPLWYERMRIGVFGLIMCHRPSKIDHQYLPRKNVEHTDHTFAKMMASESKYQQTLGYSMKFSTLWNTESIIHIVVDSSMRKRCVIQQDQQQEPNKARYHSHKGTVGLYLSVSREMASMKGNDGRSSIVGNLVLPTTSSIWACAFSWAAGFNMIIKKSVRVELFNIV